MHLSICRWNEQARIPPLREQQRSCEKGRVVSWDQLRTIATTPGG
jgi:hypothetical protein